MNDINDIMRIMRSLALLLQESAEAGNMDTSVHADVAELMGYMLSRAQALAAK